MEDEHEGAVSLGTLDAHGGWIVDELASEVREQLRHGD